MVGQKLRQLRLAKGFSQVKLALLSGYSRQWVNQVEAGRKQPSNRFIKTICQVLKVNREEVAGDEG